MSKRIVIGYNSISDPHFRVMLEEAETAIASGEEVVYAYCDGVAKICACNRFGSSFQCAKCRFLNHHFLRRLKGRARVVGLSSSTPRKTTFDYRTMEDVKRITYKGVNVGYGAFSLYSFFSRDLLDEMTDEKRHDINQLLGQACLYADCAWNLFETEKPDAISVYNGRFPETRPFLELAKGKGIPVRVNEVVLDDTDARRKEYKIFYFHDSLPQGVAENRKLIASLWGLDRIPQRQKSARAEEFYTDRRGGKPTTDTFNPVSATTFLKHQVAGSLPDDFDPAKRNLVIFNSSEDEYISIDPEFESYALYKRQYDGIRAVLDAAKTMSNAHVYLRIHPNLAKVRQPYHTSLYNLPKEYDFLTVIGATDKCSSYALMDIADKIIVFGSTIGAEATYWGKPVIQLGTSLYSLLDIAYRPKSFSELQSLLSSNLPPKSRDEAIQYGYYLCGRAELAKRAEHIDMGLIRWRDLDIPTWPRLFGSAVAMHRFRSFKGVPRVSLLKPVLAAIVSVSKVLLPDKVYDSLRSRYRAVFQRRKKRVGRE